MIEFQSRVDPTDAEIQSALLDAVSGRVTLDHILFDLRSVGKNIITAVRKAHPWALLLEGGYVISGRKLRSV